jgi:hypothetical protein
MRAASEKYGIREVVLFKYLPSKGERALSEEKALPNIREVQIISKDL